MSDNRMGVLRWAAAVVIVVSAATAHASAQITRVSVALDGTQGNAASTGPVLSGDGRFVLFSSHATNLTGEAAPGKFMHDRLSGATSRLASSPASPFQIHSLSVDGRLALTWAEPPGSGFVVLDRVTGVHQLIPPVTTPSSIIAKLDYPILSTQGGHVAYYSDERAISTGGGGHADAWGAYVWNRTTGQICDAHRAADGSAPNGPHIPVPLIFNVSAPSEGPAVSADGRFVVYQSEASNLVPEDRNPNQDASNTDVYVHDCLTRHTRLVSKSTSGVVGNNNSWNPTISGDGRFVAFRSQATNLTPEGREGVFLADLTQGTLELVAENVGLPSLSFSHDGRYLAIEGITAVRIYDRVARRLRVPPALPWDADIKHSAALTADGRYLVFGSTVDTLVANDTNFASDVFIIDLFDDDGDTMTNDWESFFGFNPASSADASLDPDGDGRTNAQEFAAGTHPKGVASATRYFAEGAATDFFDTRIALANPSSSATASVLLRFIRPDGTFTTQLVSVPPQRSHHLLVDTLATVAGGSFATVVETDAPVVADRLMWWGPNGAYGTHGEHSLAGPALAWHFAEGATHSGFELFYLVLNVNPTPASVRVRYLLPAGPPLERTYTVPGNSRFNIWVDQELFGGMAALSNTDVSAVFEVQNGVPVMVERAMYLTPPGGLTFAAGHASAGAITPSPTWFFAEGATGSYFDEYLLIANPGVSPASVRATYLLDSGVTYQKTYTVAAGSRFSVWVDEESIPGFGKVLVDAALSVRLDVLSGPSVVAERAMWWPGPTADTWQEAHNVLGATAAAPRWGFAEGAVSSAPGNTDTYFLISNATSGAATVRVTLLFNDGTPAATRTYTVAATSRFNVPVRSDFPAALDRQFGAVVESLDPGPVPIVVERAVYNDANGVHWAAGTAALGTPLP